ncbi:MULTISPECIES: 50S ribosomal protein L35 [Nocardiopsis]|jgi:large subunit ribosomal protein L35|uniref:Large ribosomal subunit protein bL35 n=3 Tax=Nocardiopsis TaxID=2013 RepID=D7B1Q3_NOCDD|nr:MULTISPECIES: 50S ribosomal protein L35 [Nocardiopsis]PDP86397.1 50S ribosomal protein L35 [Glycomyces fuscus]ADH68479.1 ribosomal protein L35 [Nocardiopsis dassonvillei subsp. dassonvillei DSM 43111]APC36569.1 50S ribosomal protein L35 [Nocardiopsis dassonvillei]ASU59501.1 50S ribosomal protein L35 [Nocardiopsis dassonvillei]MCK9869873.1 50S ribosomal protein L35 [Nocardiopsis dassonvillei]
MPKNKTHSGAKDRFKVTGSGKIMRRRANKNHILEHKTSKRKRKLGNEAVLSPADAKNMRKLLGK